MSNTLTTTVLSDDVACALINLTLDDCDFVGSADYRGTVSFFDTRFEDTIVYDDLDDDHDFPIVLRGFYAVIVLPDGGRVAVKYRDRTQTWPWIIGDDQIANARRAAEKEFGLDH